MFTGVTAGNAAFAESDEIDDILEDYCEMTLDERSDIVSKYELDEYAEKLAIVCEIENKDEREDSLDDVIDEIELEYYETNDHSDDVIDSFEDCVESGYPVMESFPEQCMTDEGTVFVNDEDDDDYDRYDKHDSLEDRLEHFCEMSNEEKDKLYAEHPRIAQYSDRLANYCEMSEDEQDVVDELIEEHGDKIRAELRDYSKDYRMDYKKDVREHLEKYCDLTDEEKRAFVAEHDKAEDHVEKMNRYCTLDEDGRMDFIEKHRDEYKAHMKDKMHDKMTDKKHMNYD